MFVVKEDNSIYATRGDVVFFSVSAGDSGIPYEFQAGDVVRIKIFGKKDANSVVLEKDFPVTAETDTVEILLTKEDTKIGEVISKPKDYWYEIELNPFTNPQTIIGYDEDGAKVFKLFPEGADIPAFVPTPEDIPFIDDELDLTSTRPVQNQAIARAVTSLRADFKKTDTQTKDTANELAVERARIDNLVSGATADDSEVIDIRVGADGVNYDAAGTAVRTQFENLTAYVDSSFVETGYASNYVSACKVFTDEYEYIMISDIRRNYSGETGFRIYSCDETGKTFSYVSTVTLAEDFAEGNVEHHFGNNSLLSCYLDLTAMSDGGRRTGDGLPFVLKQECMFPMNLNIDVSRLKETLFSACNTDPKKILTWVDDDTPLSGIASVKAICDNLGIKCSFATITENWDDSLIEMLRQYQREGFHITCHTDRGNTKSTELL